jgi:hypothetical protein
MAGALPEELRQTLLKKYHCGVWFDEPTDENIQNRFLYARALTYRVEPVVVPIVELVNHGEGAHYDTTNGVVVRGTFSGEAFVQYSDLDSFDFFRTWGFATERPSAFSAVVTGRNQAMRWKIEDKFAGAASERDLIPTMQKTADGFTLQFLMIGNKRFPRLPKGIFYRLMRDAGYGDGFQEVFDVIHHVNCVHFIDLLAALDGIELPMARTLRAVAQHQLRAIAFCYGVREI